MATWQEIRTYIFDNYAVDEDSGSMLRLLFNTGNGRSQFVIVSYIPADVPLVTFFSPFAENRRVTPSHIMAVSAETPFGVQNTGTVTGLKHVAFADTIDGPEIDLPLLLLTRMADDLERVLGLGDDL